MRTKTLLLSAAVGAAGLLAANAQVYSVNSVGYVNVTVPTGFFMLANPLKANENTLAAVLPVVPDGTTAFAWNGTGFTSKTYDELDGAWLPLTPVIPLAPGGGVFVRNSSGSPFTVTFVGEVMQGALTTPLPAGFSIVSSQVPQQGTLTQLGFPGVDGATVFRWVNNGQGGGAYVSSTYDELDGAWLPAEISVNPAEAFWVRMPSSSNWTRNFSVNQ
jgi:hypothetical protein